VSTVVVEARLTAREVWRVSVDLVLRNPISLTLIVAGPLLWLLGTVSTSADVTRLGETMSWLVVLVPAFSLLVGTFAAYRPGTGDLYVPVTWTFVDAGIDVDQPGRRARAEWSEFTGWKTVAGCYLLHTSVRQYVLVPAAGLTPEQRTDLDALLSEKLGRRMR
jgi:hypothetical protein